MDNIFIDELIYTKKNGTSCAFTGHRELGGDFDIKKLEKCIKELIEKGVNIFYNGGASGFDIVSAETVIHLKKKNDIKLIICVPFYGQERRYSLIDKERYNAILKKADEVVVLSDRYYKGCLLRRNDYMIERADYLIAYLNKETGGTYYTVNKFNNKENVIYINKIQK